MKLGRKLAPERTARLEYKKHRLIPPDFPFGLPLVFSTHQRRRPSLPFELPSLLHLLCGTSFPYRLVLKSPQELVFVTQSSVIPYRISDCDITRSERGYSPEKQLPAMTPMPQKMTEFTFQTEVAPGDKTGVYYITICNLPFETSWQQLKDWLRPHCVVDHIEVFNTSTSGWVRVRGRDNFDKAWSRLNGGVFHGRSIIASDKNKSEAIKIKELLDVNLNSPRNVQRASEFVPTQVQSPVLYCSPASVGMAPSTAERNNTRFITATIAAPHTGQVADFAAMPHYTMAPLGNLAMSRTPVGGKTFFRIQNRPFIPMDNQPQQKLPDLKQQLLAVLPKAQTSRANAVQESPLDHFKILLKNIPHRSGAKDIDVWARRRLAASEKGLNGVDVPTDESSVHPRGYAVLRFNGLVAPAAVIKKLHQQMFRGRTLTACTMDDEIIPLNSIYKRHAIKSARDASGYGPLVVQGSSGKGAGNGH